MQTFYALLAICADNSPVIGEFPDKGQWRGALMFYLICVWINGWINNGEAGDFSRHRAHYDVTLIGICLCIELWNPDLPECFSFTRIVLKPELSVRIRPIHGFWCPCITRLSVKGTLCARAHTHTHTLDNGLMTAITSHQSHPRNRGRLTNIRIPIINITRSHDRYIFVM